ncbi:MAG: RNA-binding protein [Thermoplasmata archaeon]|nr:RNA-binding protein [Thermoplasmata archaeon]
MAHLKLRRRNRLRVKEIDSLASELNAVIGCDTFGPNDIIETAEAGGVKLILLKGKPVAMFFDEEPFPTIHGLLQYPAVKRYITVDMGAVKFLANGADVMAPGVVDAHPEIKKGMPVWVRDEKNKRALAIGVALMDAGDMIIASGGKAVKTHHYVGDKFWDLGT